MSKPQIQAREVICNILSGRMRTRVSVHGHNLDKSGLAFRASFVRLRLRMIEPKDPKEYTAVVDEIKLDSTNFYFIPDELIRKIIIWTAIASSFLGIVFFLLLYQEYRPIASSDLIIERVRSNHLVGDFFYPSNKAELPVVVFLGGSGGGFGNENEMKSLALNGYAVLSLAYFKEAGLPDKLENIPLEYFQNAFDWLKTRPKIDTSKVVLMGVSRGAELALLLGSIYPQVKGVVAYSPSCFILPNATEISSDSGLEASWTLKGKPIPFAPIKRFEESGVYPINYNKYIEPLLSHKDAEKFEIKVENINGPVLLISGAKDAVWPATKMSIRIAERLRRNGFKYKFSNAIFDGGGHHVFMVKDCLPVISSIVFKKIRLTIRGQPYDFNLGGVL